MTGPVSHDRCVDRCPTGASCPGNIHCNLESSLVPDPSALPPQFVEAVTSLRGVRPRPELLYAPTEPGPDTCGRLILLHDPDGHAVWEGTFRLVCFVQARLEREQLGDEMFPVIGWSWLTESLHACGAKYQALGGTVTQTSSVRFGDIAGPRRDDDVELRASWTPVGANLSRHAEAFCGLVASAAGLPPVGVLPLVHPN